jgi:hypothetical protein
MLDILKKRQNTSTPKAPVNKGASAGARDFIPQFTHSNIDTILSKNGEVMQTIRISENLRGLNYEPHNNVDGDLRECIRKALTNHIASDNVAIWIHTLRKRRGVSFHAQYDNAFAAYVNNGWRAKNGWSQQYYNEVYITLVYDGQSGKLFDQHMFREGSTLRKNRALRDAYVAHGGYAIAGADRNDHHAGVPFHSKPGRAQGMQRAEGTVRNERRQLFHAGERTE